MVFDGDPLTRRAPLTDKVHTVARANGLPTRPADGFSIDPSQLPLIAEVLASEANDARRPAAWDDDQFWLVEADRSDRIQYLAIGNALNFRFWRADGMGLSATGGTLEGVPTSAPCTCGDAFA